MKKIVIKIGTKLLTTQNGKLDLNNLRSLVDQISLLKQQHNLEIILVTSGSITCGAESLLISPNTIPEKQAAASIGQLLLLKEYQQFFALNKFKIGQILLTRDVTNSEEKQQNVKNTISKLLDFSIIPIINENDSVITDEIQFGDNDILSCIVAKLMKVDALILLTDIDGIYDLNPHKHKDATLLSNISSISDEMIDNASDALDSKGRGGVKSKLIAAKDCLVHKIPTIIANGKRDNILLDIYNKKSIGTWVLPT